MYPFEILMKGTIGNSLFPSSSALALAVSDRASMRIAGLRHPRRPAALPSRFVEQSQDLAKPALSAPRSLPPHAQCLQKEPGASRSPANHCSLRNQALVVIFFKSYFGFFSFGKFCNICLLFFRIACWIKFSVPAFTNPVINEAGSPQVRHNTLTLGALLAEV